MIWKIIAVGRMKDPGMKAGVEDYAGRIRKYCRFEIQEIRQAPDKKTAKDILRHAGSGGIIIVLDQSGKQHTSEALARRLDRWNMQGVKDISFIIGGADGVPGTVLEKSDLTLALSSLTLPHQMARLVLVEQLYRAWTIIRGEPYPR